VQEHVTETSSETVRGSFGVGSGFAVGLGEVEPGVVALGAVAVDPAAVERGGVGPPGLRVLLARAAGGRAQREQDRRNERGACATWSRKLDTGSGHVTQAAKHHQQNSSRRLRLDERSRQPPRHRRCGGL
jgi:hypothetical protein